MIYITGDTHGDIERFKTPEMRRLKRGDTLIICGDFGFIWDSSRRESANLRKLMSKDFNIAFVDGCHENFDLLEGYPETTWNGGKVRYIGGNVYHLMRGQVFTIENRKIFTFGGGHSHDYDFRRDSTNWWEREQPTHDEITEGLHNLAKNGNKVDFIVTHEPPASLKDCLGVDVFQRLEIHAFFEEVIRTCGYEKWFFGKCHVDKHIPVRFYAVFDDIIKL